MKQKYQCPQSDEVLIKVFTRGGYVVQMCMLSSLVPYIPPKDPKQKIGLGHECSGIVVGVGKDVTGYKEGDRVCY